jgi:glycolate oxidase iron-sulfur subunit
MPEHKAAAAIDDKLLRECVHCGFCLEACPTYQLTRTEMDSPRGRIYAIKAMAEGKLELQPELVEHLDFCLGCRGCESACPAGVHYGRIIEETRAYIQDNYRRSWPDRLRRGAVDALFPYPRRLRVLLAPLRLLEFAHLRAAAQAIAPRALREWMELLPPLRASRQILADSPSNASGPSVVVHPGCVASILGAAANRNAAGLLARAGYRIASCEAPVCCGALDLHSGNARRALEFARANVRQFMKNGADYIISTASGCTTAMAEYGELLKHDPELAQPAREFSRRVADLSGLLDKAAAPPGRLQCVITYHDACHLAHGMGIRETPRKLLRAIEGLRLVEMEQSDLCCGSAGSYNLTHPQAALALGRRKVDAIEATGADYVVMANPGCQFQIAAELRRRGSRVTAIHLADFLALAAAN